MFQCLVGAEKEDGFVAFRTVLGTQSIRVANDAHQSVAFIQCPEYGRVEFPYSSINSSLDSIDSLIKFIHFI